MWTSRSRWTQWPPFLFLLFGLAHPRTCHTGAAACKPALSLPVSISMRPPPPPPRLRLRLLLLLLPLLLLLLALFLTTRRRARRLLFSLLLLLRLWPSLSSFAAGSSSSCFWEGPGLTFGTKFNALGDRASGGSGTRLEGLGALFCREFKWSLTLPFGIKVNGVETGALTDGALAIGFLLFGLSAFGVLLCSRLSAMRLKASSRTSIAKAFSDAGKPSLANQVVNRRNWRQTCSSIVKLLHREKFWERLSLPSVFEPNATVEEEPVLCLLLWGHYTIHNQN